jgi:hypothetical protein
LSLIVVTFTYLLVGAAIFGKFFSNEFYMIYISKIS